MKKILFALLFVSSQAQAGTMWVLINQQFNGSNWFCTYQAQGTNYTASIISNTVCQQYIYQ